MNEENPIERIDLDLAAAEFEDIITPFRYILVGEGGHDTAREVTGSGQQPGPFDGDEGDDPFHSPPLPTASAPLAADPDRKPKPESSGAQKQRASPSVKKSRFRKVSKSVKTGSVGEGAAPQKSMFRSVRQSVKPGSVGPKKSRGITHGETESSPVSK
tara:strand:+ start:2018 stop:2491 length:474 start_codon:yes stop_codon:yes gene_type:complete